MKATLIAPTGKVVTVRGEHLAKALRHEGWTDADTAEQKIRAAAADEKRERK